MNPELETWQHSAFHDGKIHNRFIHAIARVVWLDHESRMVREQAFREGCIRDVLDGLPVPTLSRIERAAIEEAARPILAGARP